MGVVMLQTKSMPVLTTDGVLSEQYVAECVKRGIIEVKGDRVNYNLANKKSYNWLDPEEKVRCLTIAFLIAAKDYPVNRIKLEVQVPKRTPSDLADIVVFADDSCKTPYLVVECKRPGVSAAEKNQAIEQLFGNANSLRGNTALWGLYDDGSDSQLYDISQYGALERELNKRGNRDNLAAQYGVQPEFAHIVGAPGDISPLKAGQIESKIRRAHSLIWSGGKRDPLRSFDEWSKLLFAKVQDERWTPNGRPREFQVGPGESSGAVANRVHRLFSSACKKDSSIFDEDTRINLPDRKIFEVVKALQNISFVDSDVDNIGAAFENFFGSVFRGELGQYFTMRQIARFTVAMLSISYDDYCLDPTAGSGGFLLEVLLQVWHRIDRDFAGGKQRERIKNDFALDKVFGIEIHDVLARICKINLLLHHDGHTNIEGDKSCLDAIFSRPRLNPPRGKFTRIVGNPPFGDEVREGDEDHLGTNHLSEFEVAKNRDSVASEQVILERCIELLEEGGRFGLVLPDGIFNNQGEQSNCPRTRRHIIKNGYIEAIISLPDYAFRRSGAQNKTSILFFRKFKKSEKEIFDLAYNYVMTTAEGANEDEALLAGLRSLSIINSTPVKKLYDHAYDKSINNDSLNESKALAEGLRAAGVFPSSQTSTPLGYRVFLAEANHVGYTTTGSASPRNDLYLGYSGGILDQDQTGTILGEYHRFLESPETYTNSKNPDCISINVVDLWTAHPSHRLDPKYFLFKEEEQTTTPSGWIRLPISQVMRRRETIAHPEESPDLKVKVMTITQTGEIKPRAAGKGKNPPEWLGMYFEDSSSTWYSARSGDVVFSSIDLWKGCISVVPEDFDHALVTKEFPIYEVIDDRLDSNFLWCLLRSRYYQRAFRAITTGHSNRRRTQTQDFENLEITFPTDKKIQFQLIEKIVAAQQDFKCATEHLRSALLSFSNEIDGRTNEDLLEAIDTDDEELD